MSLLPDLTHTHRRSVCSPHLGSPNSLFLLLPSSDLTFFSLGLTSLW